MKISKYKFKDLSQNLKEQLRKEVLLNFPDIKAFKTRFYYQIPPHVMFIARIGNKIVGQRYLTTKVRPIDGKRYKVAGIGVSINPEFQGRKIGQQLTRFVLNFVENNGHDLIVGITSNPISAHNLKKFGFIRFKRAIEYKDIETHKIVKEQDEVYVKDFVRGKLIRELELKKKPIYMGVGTW